MNRLLMRCLSTPFLATSIMTSLRLTKGFSDEWIMQHVVFRGICNKNAL